MPSNFDVIFFEKPRSWFQRLYQDPQQEVGLYLSIDGPTRRPINVIATLDKDGVFKIVCESDQFRDAVKESVIMKIKWSSTQEQSQKALRQMLGASEFDGTRLTSARAIAKIFGIQNWKTATPDTLKYHRFEQSKDSD